MDQQFGSTSTTDDVLSGIDLHGKRILVTGVSAGLGIETARALVSRGAHVIGAARDLDKARSATEAVTHAAAAGGGSIELIELDLADLSSVRACADKLRNKEQAIDVIIANAGVMATPLGKTADGFETQFGTNHLGHFVLVNRLMPLLPSGGRVIMLASSGHRFANVDIEDPGFERSPYDPFVAYGRSKTANILFAVALDERHKARGVRAAAVHPGGIRTELSRHMEATALATMLETINAQLKAEGQTAFTFKSVPQGAATSVWAAAVATANQIGGRYCENCHVSSVVGDDVVITPVSEGVRRYALDIENAQALWRKSEAMVGETFS